MIMLHRGEGQRLKRTTKLLREILCISRSFTSANEFNLKVLIEVVTVNDAPKVHL